MTKKWYNALRNTKTVIAVASLVILILTEVGVSVDSEAIMTIVKSACAVGVLIGVMNNEGMATSEWNK